MQTIFITGATGFVGRNLLIRAVRDGAHVLAPVRDREKLLRQIEAEGISTEAVTVLGAEPSTWGAVSPDLAVLSAGILFARDRAAYFETNVDWTLRVMEALPAGCRTIVLSSQSAGGPTPEGVAGRTEETPDQPVTWYGESKVALESALRRDFGSRPVTVLRPPMILGARDAATLPLFKMAGGLVRMKPGLRAKAYSFLAVDDVVSAILAARGVDAFGPFYIANTTPITDFELINTAASLAGGRGITLPLPQAFIRLFAAVVDGNRSLRAAMPSLTRDRVREIWPDRWVVDPAAFCKASGWEGRIDLRTALDEALRFYRAAGQL